MSVQWVTKNASSPVVVWGASADALTSTASASSSTYTQADIQAACGFTSTPPAKANVLAIGMGWVDPGTFHFASLTGLAPSTTYFYRVQDTATADPSTSSPVFSFTTAPAAGSSETVSIIYTADMGLVEYDGALRPSVHNSKGVGAGAVAKGMTQKAASAGARLFIANGDISYSDGFLADWQGWMDSVEGLAASTPLIGLPGNHERDYAYNNSGTMVYSGDAIRDATKTPAYGGECGIPYEALLAMPGTDHAKQWWSVDFGPIHFLQLSSELNVSRGSTQQLFAITDLAAVNRTRTPFVVVSWHRLMYSGAANTSSDFTFGNDKMYLQGWDDILYQYNVTAVFNGEGLQPVSGNPSCQ